MSEKRKKLSGAQYKKNKEVKSEKDRKLLSQLTSIKSFFNDSEKSELSVPEQTSSKGKLSKDNVVPGDSVVSEVIGESSAVTEVTEHKGGNIVKKDDDELYRISTDIEDPALWSINDELRDYIAVHGVKQNAELDFSQTKRIYSEQARFLSRDIFHRKLKNGEVKSRSWLVFSKTRSCVFCAPCLLFGRNATAFTEGFCDWKNATARVQQHENSSSHKSSVSDLIERGMIKGRVDSALIQQVEEETQYWKNVLRRVAATIKSLAIRGLPFRGTNEYIGSLHNGNYLGTLELIAQFDPFLSEHLKRYGTVGSGNTSYLSKQICDEFIEIMKDQLTLIILDEIKSAKYFGISVDSTPDISHVDQLTFIIRYVMKNGQPVERFLTFIPSSGHKSEQLAETVLKILESHGLDINNCRGQSHDNASNMSGQYSGLQARLKSKNPLIHYVPCAGHSLNLIGSCAAESCNEAANFFLLLQELYNFFSASTHRWEILIVFLEKELDSLVLKSLSNTRWSARHDACEALLKGWPQIVKALNAICDDQTEKKTTKSEARGILNRLERLETAIMAKFWGTVLHRFNAVSTKLQKANADLGTVVDLYRSLSEFVSKMRDDFPRFEEIAKTTSGVQEYEYGRKRLKKRKLTPFESTEEEIIPSCGEDNFRINTFIVIVDTITEELRRRTEVYSDLYSKFHFLERLKTLESPEIRHNAQQLIALYHNDLEDSLSEECIHLSQHLHHLSEETVTSLSQLSHLLYEKDIQELYPNVEIILRIFLCTPATNCSGERSFSTLRRIKNYLRASLGQERLNALALLCIEGELFKNMDTEEIISKFAAKKARRKKLH